MMANKKMIMMKKMIKNLMMTSKSSNSNKRKRLQNVSEILLSEQKQE